MTEFRGKVEIQDSSSGDPLTSLTLDGDQGIISAGCNGINGKVIFYDSHGKERIQMGAQESLFSAQDSSGKKVFEVLDNGAGGIWLIINTDRITIDATRGDMTLFDENGKLSFMVKGKAIDGNTTAISVGADSSHGPKAGYINIRDRIGNDSIILNGAENYMVLRNKVGGSGKESIINGATGDMMLFDEEGHRGFAMLSKAPSLPGNSAGTWIGGDKLEGPKAGYVFIRDSSGNDSIVLNGRVGDIILNKGGITLNDGNISLNNGDIFLNNADCAEDFDISCADEITPGTVVVIEDEDKLVMSTRAYDKRVAGVISGAGGYKPGIVFDKKNSKQNRKPVALMGKVYCKVDANSSPIEVGDMLTSSSIAGYAMKAEDHFKAFGAVIGKALGSLDRGRGLIPILVTLQ